MANILITKKCMLTGCKLSNELVLTPDQYYEYNLWMRADKKAFIQDALTTWTADMREQLMTGTHGPCWDAIFSEDDVIKLQ